MVQERESEETTKHTSNPKRTHLQIISLNPFISCADPLVAINLVHSAANLVYLTTVPSTKTISLEMEKRAGPSSSSSDALWRTSSFTRPADVGTWRVWNRMRLTMSRGRPVLRKFEGRRREISSAHHCSVPLGTGGRSPRGMMTGSMKNEYVSAGRVEERTV